MRTLTTLILSLICICAAAQFPIGHQQISYQDPARSNRSVPCEVYYPATTAGDNVAFAAGQFPLIVFGHGFVMGYDAYLFWKNSLVPYGYIIAFPTTEGSISPSHQDFGADLAFLINKVQSEAATNSGSPFYQKLTATSAIMGHSMGGGSSFLACAGNTVPTCMVTFAAAETTPSAITAASTVTIPTLVMSGAEDCVAPPASHQVPIYNALASACKVYVSIVEGIHCYFGDYNFSCTFGESTCNPVPSIQREAQEDVALDFTLLYLNHYLRNVAGAWTAFNDSLTASNRITHQISCPTTTINESELQSTLSIYPNPATDRLTITMTGIPAKNTVKAMIYNGYGAMVFGGECVQVSDQEYSLDIDLNPGIYHLQLQTGDRVISRKLIVQ